MGYFVTSKVGELDKITREGKIRSMRKEVVGCVHIVLGKKKLLVQFEDGQMKYISYYLLVFLSLKDEVNMGEPLSHYTKK